MYSRIITPNKPLKPAENVPHSSLDLVDLLRLVDSAKIRPAQLKVRLNDAQSCTATARGLLSPAQAVHGLLNAAQSSSGCSWFAQSRS